MFDYTAQTFRNSSISGRTTGAIYLPDRCAEGNWSPDQEIHVICPLKAQCCNLLPCFMRHRRVMDKMLNVFV